MFDGSIVEEPSKKAQEARDYATSISSFLTAASQAGAPIEKLNINWEEVAQRCGLILHTDMNPEVIIDVE